MITDKIAVLRRTILFGELNEAELSALADRAVERHLSRNEILFVAGDEAAGLFVIVEGALRAFREGVDGREQVIHVERAGATIAELPVFDDKPYPSTVAAEEDTTVLFLAKREVKSLCLAHPEIALAGLKLLAGRLRKCAELVEALSLREVDQRLARWLLAEARTRGKRTEKGLELDLVLTNQQIAARIGSVREVVSRALARLQQNGLVNVEGRHVLIQQEQALAVFGS
ncbi:MAG: Crp/Fnr family transcriptional regulator [Acidobacteriota bacterium]|nr:Crp/Fnr family transcriptional regulator [Acidobacteriota bacterium]